MTSFALTPPAIVLLGCPLTCNVACSDGQRFDLGEDQPLHVADATYVRAPLEVARAGRGPEVLSATFVSRALKQGTQDKAFKGTLSADALAVAIRLSPESGLDGNGYWLLPASPPFVENPEFPSFSTSLSFASSVLPGTYALSLSAIDASGVAGASRDVRFLVSTRPEVTGNRVFSLDWSSDADLDIHVVTPDDNEIYASDIKDTASEATGGALDFDSNGDCRIDGRRNENVVWTSNPAPGRYTVRVDAFSLCDQLQSYWRLTAVYEGKLIAATSGVMLPSDTRGGHGRGSGLTAMILTID